MGKKKFSSCGGPQLYPHGRCIAKRSHAGGEAARPLSLVSLLLQRTEHDDTADASSVGQPLQRGAPL